MRLQEHVAFSVPFAGGLYAATSSWQLAVAAFVSGIFVDLDHVFDYLVEYGFNLDLKNFLTSFPEGRYRRIYILLHGWEWVVCGAVVAWLSHWNPWAVGTVLGVGVHLILDQLTNKSKQWAYFLTWRCLTRFEPRRSFPKPPR